MFTWVAIPGGTVTLTHMGGYVHTATPVTVAPFAMARYPVTVADFAAFIADGYGDDRWWDYSDDARLWRLENPDPAGLDFSDGDHPRTHVAWYEAVAFCRWFSAMTGEAVRLPTEAEWQQAAGLATYPWGDEWDPARCHNNTRHQSIGPQAVTASSGDSPYGVADLVGNVWEWCLTAWSSGADTLSGDDVRVLRGGSWFDDVQGHFRSAYRTSWNPDIRSDLRGFRVVRG